MRRAWALIVKEFKQILRDPSSILLSVVLPVMMIMLFGYGINLDMSVVRTGIVTEDSGVQGHRIIECLAGSPYFELQRLGSRSELADKLENYELEAALVIPSDFSRNFLANRNPRLLLMTDASQPNTATFVSNYVQNIARSWIAEEGKGASIAVEVLPQYRFNPAVVSRYYLVPGSMCIVVSMVGSLLTSLVIAREWERGTMEALLASAVRKSEFLISKIVPYFVLAMISMTLCTIIAVCFMGVPLRSPVWLLFVMTSLFLISALGIGLLISATLRNQFSSAQLALETAVLPNMLLSGFLFELTGMPMMIRLISYFLPARYFVSALQTLFLSGPVWSIIQINVVFLIASGVFWLGLVSFKMRLRLDG